MPVFLLDANVLIALAWPEHQDHARAGAWFSHHSRSGWATCPFTQSALVRVLSNPAFSPRALTVENALRVLEANVKLPGHHFWPADIAVTDAIGRVERRLTGHGQITDAYLLGLAIHHRGKLATLDRGIAAWGPRAAIELIE